ncbi:MAG: AgmX/PglI C-terminal domain-containing protein, partial [Deltaproteobacteria bacterium]
TAHAGDASEAVREAHRFVAHATRAVFRDVVVRLEGVLEHAFPERIEQWVVGEPLRIVGERVGEIPATVRVTARTPQGDRSWNIPLGIDTVQDLGDIRRRIGLERLRALDAVGASRAALADLGVRFGLVTPTSALVLGLTTTQNNDDGMTGYDVAASLWPVLGLATRLPRLGVEYDIAPRGINAIGEWPEYPMIADDETGWMPHYEGENAGYTGMTALALGAADTAAEACVNRARSVRPSITGDVTVEAVVAADGRVTNAVVRASHLNDISAESCIRRAVAGLTLPQPALFGETPGTYTHTFVFAPSWDSPHGRACPATARLPRGSRMVLWRERIAARRPQFDAVWSEAGWRCELRTWDDRAALLALMVSSSGDPSELFAVRAALDKDGQRFVDRAVARRFGATRLWRAWMGSLASVNWDALMRQLASPTVPVERKIELALAYRTLAPWDIDVRLRLMSLYEQAGRTREARRIADELRADPFSDARVRARIGEMLIRAGDREEGLRALTEMAEFAPYDPRVRARLGDLLLTYGGEAWADEALAQCETLAALRPEDPPARVRMALAALAGHREDAALRLLRQVVEDAHDDDSAPAVEALLVSEVASLLAHRADDPAVQSWLRIARITDVARSGAVLARWTHPEVSVSVEAMQAGDTAFVPVGHESVLPMRVFAPGTALEGSRVRVRGIAGLEAPRTAVVHVSLVVPGASPRVVERDITLTPTTPMIALMVQNGALIDDPTPATTPAPAAVARPVLAAR